MPMCAPGPKQSRNDLEGLCRDFPPALRSDHGQMIAEPKASVPTGHGNGSQVSIYPHALDDALFDAMLPDQILGFGNEEVETLPQQISLKIARNRRPWIEQITQAVPIPGHHRTITAFGGPLNVFEGLAIDPRMFPCLATSRSAACDCRLIEEPLSRRIRRDDAPPMATAKIIIQPTQIISSG
jgi:hypothetical protein